MRQFSCDICGQPATVHETVLEAGQTLVHHRCPSHGHESWSDALVEVGPGLKTEPASVLDELRQFAEKNPGFAAP
jgi:hypothetical protein